jgi:hypothetical protein
MFTNGGFAASFYKPINSIKRAFDPVDLRTGDLVRGRFLIRSKLFLDYLSVVSLPAHGVMIAAQSVILIASDLSLTEAVLAPIVCKMINFLSFFHCRSNKSRTDGCGVCATRRRSLATCGFPTLQSVNESKTSLIFSLRLVMMLLLLFCRLIVTMSE